MTIWNNLHKHIKHETVIELDAVGNHFRDHHHPHEYTHEHFITDHDSEVDLTEGIHPQLHNHDGEEIHHEEEVTDGS